MILFIWFLNLGISLWNAYSVGKVWVEAKHAGGARRFMAWMGYLIVHRVAASDTQVPDRSSAA